MNAIESLLSRNSSALLEEPAPDNDALEKIFQAALRAPDHGNLKPWRFLTFKNNARVSLGQLMRDAALKTDPSIEAARQEKLLNAPLRAPLVIAGIVKLTEHPKVPEIEQWLSMGGALTNLLNAAHALGYAAMWRSGDIMFNEQLMASLGLAPNERLAGFIYLGKRSGVGKLLRPLNAEDFVEDWQE